jgi:multisubunit Na+/H+ antiporter MnhG subunit
MEQKIMDNNQRNGVSAKHTLSITGVLLGAGLLVWIIQLARAGDPVGYIILTGLGVLLALPVTGGVLAMLLHAAGKVTRPPNSPTRDDLKSIREAHQLLQTQHQYLTRLLQQAQQNPALLPGYTLPVAAEPAAPPLAPGQLQTADGFIIDGVAFDTLDETRHPFDPEEEYDVPPHR